MRARGFMQSHLPSLMLCPIPSWLYCRRRRRSRYLIDSHRCSICDYGVTDHDEGGKEGRKGATQCYVPSSLSILFHSRQKCGFGRWHFFVHYSPKRGCQPRMMHLLGVAFTCVRPRDLYGPRFREIALGARLASGDSPPAPGLPPSLVAPLPSPRDPVEYSFKLIRIWLAAAAPPSTSVRPSVCLRLV